MDLSLHKTFQEIPKIREPQQYLESAVKVAKQRSEAAREKVRKEEPVKSKAANYEYAQALTGHIADAMQQIIKKFPAMDRLPKFYKELIKATMDRTALKHSLGAIQFCAEQMARFNREYREKIRRQAEVRRIIQLRGELLGRVSSVLKNIKKELVYAEHCRREFKQFPLVAEGFTVCIFGFPNVGKTTLLYKMTGSKPEIAPYAFTTKSLNIGYCKIDHEKVQLIDTPGTLNRFEQMNKIEQQAWVAVQHCANVIMFVFDPTGTYSGEQQQELLQKIRKLDKPVIVYVSKTDLPGREQLKEHATIKDTKRLLTALSAAKKAFGNNNTEKKDAPRV